VIRYVLEVCGTFDGAADVLCPNGSEELLACGADVAGVVAASWSGAFSFSTPATG